MFLGFNIYSQNVVSDTLYFETIDSITYQISQTVYDNGSSNSSRIKVTKEDVLNYYARSIEGESVRMAQFARVYNNVDVLFARAISLNNIISDYFDFSPVIFIQNSYEKPFFETASSTVWQLETPNSTSTIEFGKTESGQLFIKILGDDNKNETTVNKLSILIGEIMGIINIDEENNLIYLYKMNDYYWTTIDRRYSIKRISN
jgi:hypothetical protein